MTQTRVKYIIPEDGDDIEHPNVFTLQSSSSSNNITFSDVKKSFPLSDTDSYHFRFLKALNPENKVWLDVMNDTDVLPTINGSIFAKVSRVGNISTNAASNMNATGTNKSPVNRPQPAVAPPPALHQPHQEANLLGDDMGFTSTPTSAPSKPVRTLSANSSTAAAVNLLDTGDFHTSAGNNDLLDMLSSSGHQSKTVDLFDTSPSTVPVKPLQQVPIMQQQSQQRGIGMSQQQQPPRTVGISQQQERKESPPQPIRGKTHDAFSGLGDFKM